MTVRIRPPADPASTYPDGCLSQIRHVVGPARNHLTEVRGQAFRLG